MADSKPKDVPGRGTSRSFDHRTNRFLPSRHDLEFKLNIESDEPVHYSWRIDGERIEYDLHGEPFDGPDGYFVSYASGVAAGGNGWFVTPFGGTHGWYLNNKNDRPAVFVVTITEYFEEIAEDK